MPEQDDYEPDLRRARRAVVHGLSNSAAIVFHGVDALEARLKELALVDADVVAILDEMKIARERAMKCFEALRGVI